MLLHAYKIRPREDKRGVDLISDALPFGRLCTANQTQSGTQSFSAVRIASFIVNANHSITN